MNLRCSLLAFALFFSDSLFAQDWSPEIAIVTGPDRNLHPATANAAWYFSYGPTWIAFSRNGKDIYVIPSDSQGSSWANHPTRITHDSADHDYPTLSFSSVSTDLMMVWQGRSGGDLELLFSVFTDSGWSVGQLVGIHPSDDTRPSLAPRSSGGWGVTWERDGSIMFAEYISGVWTSPETISAVGSAASNPDLWFVSTTPIVIWEELKSDSTTFKLNFSYRSQNVWQPPDTITAVGNSRNPKFFDVTGHAIVFDSEQEGEAPMLYSMSYGGPGPIQWYDRKLLVGQTVGGRKPAVNGLVIITERNESALTTYFSAAAWEISGSGLGLLTIYSPTGPIYLSPPPMRSNPALTNGNFQSGGYVIWAVWESDLVDSVHLVGSSAFFPIDGVGEVPDRHSHRLLQNYPNPFNPLTNIKFQIPSSQFVSLEVFDILGRKVKTLANEIVAPGNHSRTFEADGLAGGIYFYRLRAGEFVQTRKMLLIK